MIKNNFAKYRKFYVVGLFFIACLIYYVGILRPQKIYYETHHVKIRGIYLLKPIAVPDFTLIDTNNQNFTKANLKNHWTFLFFGFTHCGMVCPLTLSSLNKTYELLQKTLPNKLPQVVFISIDPERDTAKKIKDYVTTFNSQFIGARGSLKATIALEKQMHIVANKIPAKSPQSSNYNIDHSSDILLINPKGMIQAYFTFPFQPTELAKDYQKILKKFEFA